MENLVKNGTLIIAEGTTLPEALDLQSNAYGDRWRIVTNFEGYGLDRNLRQAGWTFVYKAQKLKVNVFGFGRNRTIRKAFNTILQRLGPAEFNCLEITEAVGKSFLGFPYVSVSGHARLIQQRS